MWRADGELATEYDDGLARHKGPMHIEAPKMPPPGHAESYNPPDE